jgi:hypothetical protein
MSDELHEEETGETPETKIAATNRLQRNGRWEQASKYRGEQRKKFRSEGLTKKAANEKAWEAMMLKYPAPDTDEFVFYLAMSKFTPLDSETNIFICVYCRVRALLHFTCPTEMSQLDGPVAERRLEPQVELPPTLQDAVDRFNNLLEFSFEHTVDFLGHASEVFGKAVALSAESTRLEQGLVRSIPVMQRIVQQRFASGALSELKTPRMNYSMAR